VNNLAQTTIPNPPDIKISKYKISKGKLEEFREKKKFIPFKMLVILCEIGKGEFGKVFKAKNIIEREEEEPEEIFVAIKTIKNKGKNIFI
jgi:hypothetical protein